MENIITRRKFVTTALAFGSAALFSCSPLNKLRGVTTVSVSDSRLEKYFWNNFKRLFLKDLPNGTIVDAPWYPIAGQTPSEGMGHALIISAQREDWAVFDALLKGLSYFKKANGLFRWRIKTDGTFPPSDENLNSASETDQNIAYALLLAYEKTSKSDYKTEALKLLQSIWKEEMITFQGRMILMPSDRTSNPYWPLVADGQGKIEKLIWNPSYHSPKMFRKYAAYDKTHDWGKVINDWYAIANAVLNAANANPGRFGIAGINPMPQWVWLTPKGKNEIDINPFFPARDALGSKYSDEGDTIRIPIYVGMDASSSEGRKFLERFYSGMNLKTPQEVVIRLNDKPKSNNIMAIGAYAVGLKAIGRDVTQFLQRIKIDENGFAGDARGQYYDQIICYYAWLLLNNRFPF
jgi:endo-1,4-beta-D-glucanase Y